MIASLPMYDFPWLRAANDRLWSSIAAQLEALNIPAVPVTLARSIDLEDLWQSPDLLLAQTCGFPLMTDLRETVQLVATPQYRAEGCDGAWHRAAIVVRADNRAGALEALRGARAGVNSWGSNTGMNLLRAAIAPLACGSAFFGKVIVTGSHARSLAAILSGRIDVASIDAVSLALLRDHFPRYADGIRILDWTAPTPGLPLVTGASTPPKVIGALRHALDRALSDPALTESLARLRIAGFAPLEIEDYASVLRISDQAVARNYAVIR